MTKGKQAAAPAEAGQISKEHAEELQQIAAEGKPLPGPLPPVELAQAATRNNGIGHGTFVTSEAGTKTFELTCTGVWGIDSTLEVAIETCADGKEASLHEVGSFGPVTAEGVFVVTAELEGYSRIAWRIGGTDAAFAFGVREKS